MSNEPLTVSEACALARLALALARHRGVDDPELWLPTAARLATQAGEAWEAERHRRSSENPVEALDTQMEAALDTALVPLRVPFNRLCRPDGGKEKHYEKFDLADSNGGGEQTGGTFTWLVFTTERGFKDLMGRYSEFHANALHADAKKRLAAAKDQAARMEEAATQAREDAKAPAHGQRDATRTAEAVRRAAAAKANADEAARELVAAKDALKEPYWYRQKAVKALWATAKAGTMTVVTVKALHDSRKKSNVERAAKGGKAKALKMGQTRASAAGSAVK